MSAIWGYVDWEQESLSPMVGEKMQNAYRHCKIDRYETRQAPHVLMGCGIQYVSSTAEKEVLPIWDEEEGQLFTADCFLGNRAQLMDELGVADKQVPDGTLLFLAYKKWKENVCKHVYGSYAFAVFDTGTKTLMLAADHTFSRTIYYCRRGGKVFFSTLLLPIVEGKGEGAGLDDEFLALFLANINISILTNPVDTAFAGVKRVVASQYMLFSPEGERAVEYWSPREVKPLALDGDDAYRERYCSIFSGLAREATGAGTQMGIFLSSGFDSSSVAAFVAPELAKEGRHLNAYTWVPKEGYESRNKKLYSDNEQRDVESFCAMYPNIRPSFLSVSERDAITSVSDILSIHETPYKAIGNLPWVEGLEAQAARDGCRIMLTGQYGNNTVSNGRIELYLSEMVSRGKWGKAFKALNRYALSMGIPRKAIFPRFLLEQLPLKVRQRMGNDYLAPSFLNRELAEKLGIHRWDSRIELNSRQMPRMNLKSTQDLIFYPLLMAQTSDALTKFSLRHGTISLDLTRDIRMIQFCMSVPLECFVNETQTRRMVRCYLSDRLPPQYLPETRPMGVQSGDMMERITNKWDVVRPELERVLHLPGLARYVDGGKMEAMLSQFKEAPTLRAWDEFTRLGHVYVLGSFLEAHGLGG